MPDPASLSLAGLPCVPESRLPADLLAQLPLSTPAPPWPCRVRAVVWVQRAPSPLPSSSRYAGRVRPLAVGALVDYLDSPVGAYREVLVGQLLRGTVLPVLHVPFIAVDSLPSVHGGRLHWSLPKTIAHFSGDLRRSGTPPACRSHSDVDRRRGNVAATATGEGWSVDVRATPRWTRLPIGGPLTSEQDGRRAVAALRGRGRLARVQVTATGLTLGGWLGSGSHPGVVAEGRMVVHPPRP